MPNQARVGEWIIPVEDDDPSFTLYRRGPLGGRQQSASQISKPESSARRDPRQGDQMIEGVSARLE